MRNFIEGFKKEFKGFWKGLLPKDWKQVGEMTAYFICMSGVSLGAILIGTFLIWVLLEG